MSPSRTSDCCCNSSTNFRKRERLMRPTGRSSARMRAPAIGDKGSTPIATFGAPGRGDREDYVLIKVEGCRDGFMHDVLNIEAVTLRFGDMRCMMTQQAGPASVQRNTSLLQPHVSDVCSISLSPSTVYFSRIVPFSSLCIALV
jgi:hypothetical protein